MNKFLLRLFTTILLVLWIFGVFGLMEYFARDYFWLTLPILISGLLAPFVFFAILYQDRYYL